MPISMKNLIVEKFEEMARSKPIDRITVTDLVQACGISRQTFYYHYQDILDVIEATLRRGMEQLQARCRTAGTLEEKLRVWLSLSLDNSGIIHRLVSSQQHERILEVLRRTVHASFRDMIRTLLPWSAMTDNDQETVLNFCTYGLVGILIDASREDHPDVNRLAQQLLRLLTGELHVLPTPV